jgi:hypothetical protein
MLILILLLVALFIIIVSCKKREGYEYPLWTSVYVPPYQRNCYYLKNVNDLCSPAFVKYTEGAVGKCCKPIVKALGPFHRFPPFGNYDWYYWTKPE